VVWNGVLGHVKSLDGDQKVHPTQKPVKLLCVFVQKATASGGIVADPFVGSGTTIMACQHLGRRCFACEIEPAYVDVCLRRYRAKYPDAAMVRHDGATWEEAAR
jgi:DNA modification methylase